MWNFKRYLSSSSQNILPIHWKVCILFTGDNLRALRLKTSQVFLKCPLVCTRMFSNWITIDSGDGLPFSRWQAITKWEIFEAIWNTMHKISWLHLKCNLLNVDRQLQNHARLFHEKSIRATLGISNILVKIIYKQCCHLITNVFDNEC